MISDCGTTMLYKGTDLDQILTEIETTKTKQSKTPHQMIRTFITASLAAAAAAFQTSNRLEQILAQLGLETESTEHTCLTTANRNKEAVDQFYDLLAKGKFYSDDDFTPNQSAIYWKDIDTIGV